MVYDMTKCGLNDIVLWTPNFSILRNMDSEDIDLGEIFLIFWSDGSALLWAFNHHLMFATSPLADVNTSFLGKEEIQILSNDCSIELLMDTSSGCYRILSGRTMKS